MTSATDLPPLTDTEKTVARAVLRHHIVCLAVGGLGCLLLLSAMGMATYGIIHIVGTGDVPAARDPIWWIMAGLGLAGTLMTSWRPGMSAEMGAVAAELERRDRIRRGPWAT